MVALAWSFLRVIVTIALIATHVRLSFAQHFSVSNGYLILNRSSCDWSWAHETQKSLKRSIIYRKFVVSTTEIIDILLI